MSKRSPNVQPRNGHHQDWGIYESPDLLPNRPGFTAPANLLEPLDLGDTAYVDGQGRWYCDSAGTPGLGDAVWFPSAVFMQWETIDRTIVKDQRAIFLPWGSYVLANSAFVEASISTDGGVTFSPLVFGVDYVFQTRQNANSWPAPSTADTSTGIWLLNTYQTNDIIRLRWRSGHLDIEPPTPVLVYAPGGSLETFGAGTKPWRFNGAQVPNAFLVATRPPYQIEVWRYMEHNGRQREPASITNYMQYRGGRRFSPYYRDTTATPGEIIIIPGSTFNARGKSSFRLAYYDPQTGSRSDLSSQRLYYTRQRKDIVAGVAVHPVPSGWVSR